MNQEYGKIILRETQDLDSIKSREISFYGNSLNSKENADKGEIINSQELGYEEKIKLDDLSNLNNVFEVIAKYRDSEYNIIISPENNGEVKEYYRLNNEFIETTNNGIDLQYAISKYVGYLQDEFLYVDGSKDMDNGYYPNLLKSIITKEYLEKFNEGRVVTTDDPTMDTDYEPILEGDVYTKKNFENGEVDFVNLIPREVDCNFVIGSVLYYDEIEQKFKRYSCEAHIRYFTTQPLTFSDGVTRNPTNGYIDIISDDEKYLIYAGGQENVTKIQVLRYGNRTSWKQLAYYCRNMTEFEVLATDESKVTDFGFAWSSCSSLTSFPELDTSNGINFAGAWRQCSSLTSFPELDTSNGTDFWSAWYNCSSLTSFPVLNVSNGTNFGFAWSGCSSLTSFPQLDVSNGADFSNAWYRCTSLTSFPQLDVSNGADFGSAWAYCTSLTSFPVLDVSNGTSFGSAWQNCTSLTSFPVLDVSNGVYFNYAWYDCVKLPHCPAGNEITIPSGANTDSMCSGGCCTG